MNYKDTTVGINRFQVQSFNSIYDFTTYLDSSSVSNIFKGATLSSQEKSYSDNWNGTQYYNEAQELLAHGWTPEASALSKKIPLGSTMSQASKRTNIYSTVGFQASVPRYLQGVPTNMISSHKTMQKQKVIVLNRSIVFASGWTSHKIESEGIKALQVIKALEGNGFRVKLNVFTIHNVGNDNAVMTICIKKPDEPLNISKIAFPIAHPKP